MWGISVSTKTDLMSYLKDLGAKHWLDRRHLERSLTIIHGEGGGGVDATVGKGDDLAPRQSLINNVCANTEAQTLFLLLNASAWGTAHLRRLAP